MDPPAGPATYEFSTIDQLVVDQGRAHGDEPFVIEEATGEQLTYAETATAAARVGAALATVGVERGDVVATLLPNSIDHVRVWFGCARIGAVFAPLNVQFKDQDLRHCLENVDPVALVVDEAFADQFSGVREEVGTDFRVYGRGVDLDGAEPFANLAAESAEDLPDRDVGPGDPGLIQFTGGTTGLPKPVVYSNFTPVAGAYRYVDAYDPDPSDRHYTVLQLFHAGGQQWGVLGPMLAGISTVINEWFSASSYFDRVNEYEATLLDPMGGMLGALLQTHEGPVENTGRVATGLLDAARHEKAERRFDLDILHAYGLTEAGGGFVTYDQFDSERETVGDGSYVGRTHEMYEVAILDGDTRVGPGAHGEICVRPTMPGVVMDRYDGNPEATVEAFADLWLHTGDIGYMDEDGALYFVGREAHWIRRMGENLTSYEVEEVLDEHLAVVASAVVGVPNEEIGGEDVKAYVQASEDVSPADLVAWCRDRLADFKVPRYVEFVDEFPRSTTKNDIERYELKEREIGDAWDRRDHE